MNFSPKNVIIRGLSIHRFRRKEMFKGFFKGYLFGYLFGFAGQKANQRSKRANRYIQNNKPVKRKRGN